MWMPCTCDEVRCGEVRWVGVRWGEVRCGTPVLSFSRTLNPSLIMRKHQKSLGRQTCYRIPGQSSRTLFHQGQQGQTDRPPHTDRRGTTTECSVATCSDWLMEQKEDSNRKTGDKQKTGNLVSSNISRSASWLWQVYSGKGRCQQANWVRGIWKLSTMFASFISSKIMPK